MCAVQQWPGAQLRQQTELLLSQMWFRNARGDKVLFKYKKTADEQWASNS